MYEDNTYARRLYTVLSDWLQKENSEISTGRDWEEDLLVLALHSVSQNNEKSQ